MADYLSNFAFQKQSIDKKLILLVSNELRKIYEDQFSIQHQSIHNVFEQAFTW